jgi:hypothetical protein
MTWLTGISVSQMTWICSTCIFLIHDLSPFFFTRLIRRVSLVKQELLTRVHSRFQCGLCCSIFSFLCSVLYVFVCTFVLFLLAMVVSVLQYAIRKTPLVFSSTTIYISDDVGHEHSIAIFSTTLCSIIADKMVNARCC